MASSGRHLRLGLVLAVLFTMDSAVTALSVDFVGGTGEPNDPYRIATAEQLISMGTDPNLLEKHFALVADIDLDPNLSRDWIFDRAVIAPDVNGTLAGFQGKGLAGCLDGRGHVIRNLYVEAPDCDYIGLIGCVAEGGRITHLGLEQVVVRGRARVGGMVRENHGTVTCSYLLGDVVGHEKVGGMVGSNCGQVADCYSVPVVHGTHDVGGSSAIMRQG